jgi:hypothetical protein
VCALILVKDLTMLLLFLPFSLMFPFFLSVKLFDLYYSISRVLLRLLGGVIFITVGFYYSVLPFVPL